MQPMQTMAADNADNVDNKLSLPKEERESSSAYFHSYGSLLVNFDVLGLI